MSYHPPFTITDEMIGLIADIANALGKIEHWQHSPQAVRLRKISRIKTITGTLQIEGNTLDEQQITAVLAGKPVLGSMREIAEAQGAVKVYQQADKFDYLDLTHLLEAHKILMGDLVTHAGCFRTQAVGVGNADGMTHLAPPAQRVSGLMTDLFEWLRTTTSHPLIASSVFHYEFEFIHPFVDGNGRMGRLWQYLILCRWNPVFALVPVENMIKARQEDYYQALQRSGSSGESTPFILFMLEIILQTIQENAPVNVPQNAPVNIEGMKTPDAIIALVQADSSITRQQMAKIIGKDIRTIGRAIKKLQDSGKLKREGSDKAGYWEII